MTHDAITRRRALRRTAVGALAVWGSGCGPEPKPDPGHTTPRPPWLDSPPTADDAWFGIGEGPDRRGAWVDAVDAVARQIEARVTSRTTRVISERTSTDELTGPLDLAFVDDFRARVSVDASAVVPGVQEEAHWTGPGKRVWLLVRAPRSPMTELLRAAVEKLLRQWNPARGDRVVILPPVDALGRATSLSAHVLGGLVEHLRASRPDLDLFAPPRPADAASLEQLLAEPPSVALIYGEVEAFVDRLLLRLKAMAAPSLIAEFASVTINVPRRGEVAVMHGRVRQYLHGIVKPLLMGLAADGAEISLEVEPVEPLPGDLVRIHVRSDQDGWLTLFDIDPAGNVGRIVPLMLDQPFRVTAGRVFTVPDDVPAFAGKALRAFVPEHPGPERLKAIVTPEPVPALADAFGPFERDRRPAEHARRLETLRQLQRLLLDLPGAGVASATYSVRRP